MAGPAAEKYVDQGFEILKKLEGLFKTHNILTTIEKTLSENSELKKQRDDFHKDIRSIARKNLTSKIRNIGSINLIAEEVQLKPADNIKTLAFELKSDIENLVLVIGANLEGKAHLTIMISEDLVKDLSLDARQMIREVSADIQGGGGGQDFYATAGGKNPAGITKAISKIVALVENGSPMIHLQ